MKRQRFFGMRLGLMLIFAIVAGGSVLFMQHASEGEAHSVPPFVDGAIPSSAVCTDFVLDLGLIDIDIPDPGWVWVNAGNPGLPQYRSVSGVVTKSKITHTDFPAVHDSHDQNTDILVDPGYESILSDAGKDENGDGDPDTIELEWEIGTFPSETGSDPERTFPKWAWPNLGDRVWADGHWIFDCGHPEEIEGVDHARSEIHPARAIASMRQQVRTLPGTGTTPVPVTVTDLYVHGRAGFVSDILNCGMNIIDNGGECTPYPHYPTPIAEDFEFDICLPPLPFDKAALATYVEQGPGNTVTDTSLAPDIQPEPAEGPCAADPTQFGPTQLHVTVPLGGSAVTPDDVYAWKIYAGWVYPPDDLRHLKLTLNLMDLHEDQETDPGDCECTFFWMNVDKAPDEWIRLSTYATGDMNDYDDDEGLGDGEMGFSGAVFDFYVANGQPFTVRAYGYDQDCLDDWFGDHDFQIATFLDCYLLAALELNPGDNDEFASLGASFGTPGYGVGAQDVTAGGEYELEFTVEDVPLGAAGEDTADLSLEKVCKPDDTALAGDTITCDIIVQNSGPGLPRNVVVDDVLLTDVDPADYVLSPPTFTFPGVGFSDPCITEDNPIEEIAGGKEFRCEIGTVPVGGKGIITFTVTSDEGGDFNNLARVFTDSTDPDLSNNQDEDSVHVIPVADLTTFGVFGAERQVNGEPGLTVDTNDLQPLPELPNYNFGGTTVTAGRRIEFTLSTTNGGPSQAENVRMEFLLPFGASVIENTVNPVASPGGEPGRCYTEPAGELRKKVICQYDTLALSEFAQAKFQVLIDPGLLDGTQLSFDTMSRSEQFDPNLGNNVTSIQFDVDNWADLSLTKFAVGNPVAGQDIHYEYQVHNRGPSVARDVTLRDFLPQQMEFLSAFVDIEGGTGGVPLPCTITVGSNALFCPLGDIAPTGGVPIFVFVDVHIKANVPEGTSLTNSADLFLTDTPDPYLANNSDSATVQVLTKADLSITKTTDRDLFKPSTTVKYTITVTNNGPSDAQNVIVMDMLPPAKTGYRVFDTGYLYDPDGCLLGGTALAPTLRCEFGTLAAGASIQFDLYFRVVGNKGEVTNTVTGASDTPDPNAANNTAVRKNLIQGKDTGRR